MTRVQIPAVASGLFFIKEKARCEKKAPASQAQIGCVVSLFQKGKNVVAGIALARMLRLFELAEQEFEAHPERSKRYVELARRIGMRNSVKMPRELKRKFCKKCGAYLKKGKNATEETQGALLIITCKECGAVRKTSAAGTHKPKIPAKV